MRTYDIDERPHDVGGGYSLVMLEDGEEVARGVFPAVTVTDHIAALEEANECGQSWADSGGAPVQSKNRTAEVSALGLELTVEYADTEDGAEILAIWHEGRNVTDVLDAIGNHIGLDLAWRVHQALEEVLAAEAEQAKLDAAISRYEGRMEACHA